MLLFSAEDCGLYGDRGRRSSAMKAIGAWKILIVATAAALTALAAPALAAAKGGPTPVTGGAFTTVDQNAPPAGDGTGHCQNGNPAVNCNIYTGKIYVWLNGGPLANSLDPAGTYFWAVLDPSGQSNPNDGAAGNLSSPYDCYQNREFTITNGEVSAYHPASLPANCFPGGTPVSHRYDAPLINLYPYANTTNPGGVYIMAICKVPSPPSTTNAPGVTPSTCKYDAFKVPTNDTTPPVCTATTSTVGGQHVIDLAVQDAESGIETITVTTQTNVTVTLPSWTVGSLSVLHVTGTQVNTALAAALSIKVTNVAGLSTNCGGTLPPLAPPNCSLFSTTRPGTVPKQITVAVQASAGLVSITASTTNATASVPSFASGDTGVVYVTATKTNQSRGALLVLTVKDLSGNTMTCDPMLATLAGRHLGGGGLRQVFHGISAAESNLLITSGPVAFGRIEVLVNGRLFKVVPRRSRVTYVNLARAMKAGQRNTIVIRGLGKRQASADILLSD